MAGVRALRKIQLGKEGTAGSAAAATAIWRGTGTLEDGTQVVQPDENVGYLAPVERSYIPTTEASLSMDAVPATYEQLGYILLAGIDGTVSSGSRDSSGGYAYVFGVGTTAQKTPQTYTIEGGDNSGAERFAYGFVTDFTLTGAPRQAVQVSANWKGRQIGPQAYTAALALQSVEEVLFGKATLYIDDVSAIPAATTAKSNTLLGFTLNINTGFVPVFTANGQVYFDFVKQVAPEITLDVTFEHDATSIAEKAKWLARTPRLVRIYITGSTIANGSTYAGKALIIDLAGHWETFTKIDEQDGNDIVTGTLRATLNTGAEPDLFTNITVVNALAGWV
jgi:hypothetical protein